MENRTTRSRAVRINRPKKTVAFKKFLRRYPYLSSVAATIVVFALVTIVVALIQRAANSISGNQESQNPVSPVALPPPWYQGISLPPETSPPNLSTTVVDPATVAPAPAPPPAGGLPEEEPTDDSQPYSSGDCLVGNFESSTPTGVHKVSCASSGAYEVLASYPDETDETVCESVKGAELAYIQEELENGAVIWSYVQCLGRP